jgi:uroporphyrinogen-III synthase
LVLKHMHLLAGRRIVVTRAPEQSHELVECLRALGAEPLICPAIAFAPPIDAAPLMLALRQLAHYDWLLFTSANAVRFTNEALAAQGSALAGLNQLTIGAIGPATARAVLQYGGIVRFVPSKHTAEDLLAEIGPVAGQRILLPAADLARDALAAGLQAMGAAVDVVIAYRTIPGDGGKLLAQYLKTGTIDATTFTSPSTIHYLLDGLAAAGIPCDVARKRLGAIVCIGPVTSAAAHNAGLQVAAEPATSTVAGLVQALSALFK